MKLPIVAEVHNKKQSNITPAQYALKIDTAMIDEEFGDEMAPGVIGHGEANAVEQT